ncbi:LCCL domain-containing protein [Coniella lustricola]|uniref:LCCL domain-containing protein n=1 Tax=Coniella lustricola TaxID=2025994 RepID=A0A2T3AHI6_9PEZI|nr:LCCL domain-containing protein [Coniella lustricola]
MAAPADITLKNLNGKFALNKSLSDDNDPILKIQGIGWIQRKAISAANLELTIKTYEQDGTTHLDTAIKPSLGPPSTEERVLDWATEIEVKHPLFGNGKAQAKWIKVSELQSGEHADEFLASGWESGTDELIIMQNTLDSGAVTKLVHGFEVIKGERYYVRHVLCKKGSEVAKVKLVYDYAGSA